MGHQRNQASVTIPGTHADRVAPGTTSLSKMETPPANLGAVKTTHVYDTFWRFAVERQNVFFRRLERQEQPWTADPILATHKFTNAYRASDRTTQYLIRNIIYRPGLPDDVDEIVFRILLFKFFNKIATWELLERSLGPLTYADYSVKHYDRLLSAALGRGQSIYSAAYIMPSGGPRGESRKHVSHLRLLQRMMSDQLPKRLADTRSMREAFNMLREYATIGDFLAYQYATDINYSVVTNFTEMEFVAPGPGAIDGIRKCFADTGGVDHADMVRLIADRQEIEFNRLGIEFRTLWGRPLQLVDCQNLLCEVDKYARVAHPTVSGVSGRKRIKQKFRPNAHAVQYWYPPKWRINDLVAREQLRYSDATDLFTVAREETMDLRTYQDRVSRTDQNPAKDEEARMIPLAGLASETGELLGEYKKYLRDGSSHKLFTQRLTEEIGDLLWYVADLATKFDLDLNEIAERNLTKCRDRWGALPTRQPFDARFPPTQRFPRKFSVDLVTYQDDDSSSKVRVTYKGNQFGDDLDANSIIDDGYRFHDVIHLAFVACLGWSPLVRKMINAKRKSDPVVDRVEDGGRAIAIEEGVSAMIFAFARDYDFLEGKSSLSTELLRLIRNMVSHLEVSVCTAGEWEHAIVQGFKVWREIKGRGRGTIDLDLDERSIVLRGT